MAPTRILSCSSPPRRVPLPQCAGILLVGWLAGLPCLLSQAQAQDPLARFTGAPTRVVWVQDTSRAAKDVQAQGTELLLMGYDSEDGRGERELLSKKSNYARPLLSPDGRRVIFTDRTRGLVMLLEWGSDRPQRLARGAALCTWHDPDSKTDWAIIGQRVRKAGSYFYRNLVRVRLDDTSVSKPVWSKTRVSPDNFQLSRNGRFAAGVFPWPNGGLVGLDPPTLTHLGKGCWASLAPDNSRLAWVFDGPHRHLRLSAPDNGPKWKVAVADVAGLARGNIRMVPAQGAEMFHPRWSNHVGYLVLSGPYSRKGPINAVSGGGPQVEIYLARFADDFRSIKTAARVTKNSKPDFFPDAWIASGPASQVPASALDAPRPTAEGSPPWPPAIPNLLWAFRDTRRPVRLPAAKDRPETTCRLRHKGRTRPGRFFELRLSRGSAEISPLDPGLVAHWNARQTLSISMLLTITPTKSKRPGVLLAIEPPASSNQPTPGNSLTLALNPLATGSGFSLSLATSPDGKSAVELVGLKPDTPTHLVLTLDRQGVRLRVDRKPTRRIDVPLGQLQLAPGSRLRWGNNASGIRGCDARISHITLSAAALDDAGSQPLLDAITLALKSRRPGKRAVIRARCVETSPVPTPAQIAPYRRALVYHHYRIDRVESGRLTHREILVGHWAILDGKFQPGRRRAIGRSVRLVVEPLEDHPQLDSERQVMEVERIDLPLYVDVE